jgi:putative oligomerization/nucleic acid binding protein
MLFLYRPRETWMPFARPMSGTQQAAYNRQLQAKFASTRRVAPALPAPAPPPPALAAPQRDVADGLARLDALHSSGALTDAEFASAKKQLLAS